LEFLNKAWLAQNPEAGAPALSYASPPPTALVAAAGGGRRVVDGGWWVVGGGGGDAHGGCCGCSALRNRFDRVRNWVATEILKGVNDDVRAQVIFNFIQIAEVHIQPHTPPHTHAHAPHRSLHVFALQRCLLWAYDSIACK
jgi:hypothetical protein